MEWSNPLFVALFVLIVGPAVVGPILWFFKLRHGVMIKVDDDRRRFVTYKELETWHQG